VAVGGVLPDGGVEDEESQDKGKVGVIQQDDYYYYHYIL
jgi:hypothetical protein